MKTAYLTWLSKKLSILMEGRGLTSGQMAQYLNMKLSTFRAYLEARAEPSNLNLKKICKKLGTTMDKFMEDCPEQNAKYLQSTEAN